MVSTAVGARLAIVEGVRGRQWRAGLAESLPRQGTVFVVQLPLSPHPAASGAGEPRVLVCDDEPQIVRALKVVLREAGFVVDATASAGKRSTPLRSARRMPP